MIRRLKNVTITLDPETAQWARIEAARRDQSVSRFIAELLQDRMLSLDEYEAAKQKYFDQPPVVHRRPGQAYPSRDDLHERERLR